MCINSEAKILKKSDKKLHLVILLPIQILNILILSCLSLFYRKNKDKNVSIHIFCTFAHSKNEGPLAQLNRVFDYGSKGCRFESCRGRSQNSSAKCSTIFSIFLFIKRKK